jgi:hypothetical protein
MADVENKLEISVKKLHDYTDIHFNQMVCFDFSIIF